MLGLSSNRVYKTVPKMTPLLLELPDLLCVNLKIINNISRMPSQMRRHSFSLGGDGDHICPKRPVSTTRVYQMTVRRAGSAEMLSKCYRICKIPFIYVKAHVIMHS